MPPGRTRRVLQRGPPSPFRRGPLDSIPVEAPSVKAREAHKQGAHPVPVLPNYEEGRIRLEDVADRVSASDPAEGLGGGVDVSAVVLHHLFGKR